jgi:hypothetical protein
MYSLPSSTGGFHAVAASLEQYGAVAAPPAPSGHECNGHCHVVHEFGNLYRCLTSGTAHICDQNCDQRLWNGVSSTICRVSKKLFPPFQGPHSNSSGGASVDCHMQTDICRCLGWAGCP